MAELLGYLGIGILLFWTGCMVSWIFAAFWTRMLKQEEK